MADNINTTPGTGATIAADDVGGVLHQRVKISVGADGAAVDAVGGLTADGGASSGVIAATSLVWDGTSSVWRLPRTPDSDGRDPDLLAASGGMVYNGATFDRQRGNLEGTLLASASRTTTTGTATQTNYNHRGVLLELNVTAAGTGTLQIALQQRFVGDVGMCTNVASGGTGLKSLLAYPGVLDADYSGDARSVTLPRTWSAYIIHTDGSSWTYSLSYSLIL